MAEKMVVPSKRSVSKKIPEQKEEKVNSDATVEVNEEKTSPNIPAWKEKIVNKIIPRVLKAKAETWDTKVNTPITEARKKGITVFVYSLYKAGKTRLGLTASHFEGFEGKKRSIPKGYPVFDLDTEESVMDEAELKFEAELAEKKILIESCFIEDPQTKEVDPTKSMEKIEEWAYSLENEEEGTLVIDTFTDYCDYAYYKMLDKSKINFSDWKADKNPTPIQQKWKTKKVVNFMRKLRNMHCNKILIAQGKDEYEKTGDGAMDFKKTGRMIADAIEKAGFWMDVICVMEKSWDASGNVYRRLQVMDSKFEKAQMNEGDYVLENEEITFANIINLFKDVL